MARTLTAPSPAPQLPDTPERPRSARVSVVVPVTERPEPLAALYAEFSAPLREAGIAFEFVFVAEPWHAALTHELEPLAARGEPIRVLTAGQRAGETALLRAAAEVCEGTVVVTLPSYRRVEAAALPELIACVDAGVDMATARRWPRRDSWVNRLQGWAFHRLLGGAGGGRIRDVGCGVRAFRREVLFGLPLYGDFGRFLPVIALREGFVVEEIPVGQHAADTHARFYGPGVYLRRLMDVLNLFFLLKFTDKPLRFFGLPGSVLAGTGSVLLVYLLIGRIGGQSMADRPLLLLAVLLVTLGAQAVALGLIGEIIVHLHAPHRKPYRIRDVS